MVVVGEKSQWPHAIRRLNSYFALCIRDVERLVLFDNYNITSKARRDNQS